MLFAAFCGCLAGVVLAFGGRSGSCSRRIDITIFLRRSFLPACLPLSTVSFLFTFLASLPHPHLSSPLPLRSFSPHHHLLSSAPPIPTPNHLFPSSPFLSYTYRSLPATYALPLVFTSEEPPTTTPVLFYIYLQPCASYIYKYPHIHIYISVHLGSSLRTASTAVDFAASVLAVRFLVGSK